MPSRILKRPRPSCRKRLNLSDAYIDTVWKQNQFSVSLDMSLVTTMEDEGRWMINNNLTTEKTIPNYQNYIYTKGLEEVKPNAVNTVELRYSESGHSWS